jgi:hypothetical protein
VGSLTEYKACTPLTAYDACNVNNSTPPTQHQYHNKIVLFLAFFVTLITPNPTLPPCQSREFDNRTHVCASLGHPGLLPLVRTLNLTSKPRADNFSPLRVHSLTDRTLPRNFWRRDPRVRELQLRSEISPIQRGSGLKGGRVSWPEAYCS